MIWLIMIGLLLGVLVLSSSLAPQVEAAILSLYLLVALGTSGLISGEEVRRRLPQRPRLRLPQMEGQGRGPRASEAARRAQERARNHPAYGERFALLDVGLIVSEVGPEGMRLRRGEATLDDQAIQPYVVLRAAPPWVEEKAIVRFEVLDSRGDRLFVCEDEVYLRQGVNNILASHRLPLRGRSGVQPGLWDLHVVVQGHMLAMHSFGVGPSLRERERLFRDDRAQQRLRDVGEADGDDDSPISLEDLLRGRQ